MRPIAGRLPANLKDRLAAEHDLMQKHPVPAGSRAWKKKMKSKLLLSLLLTTVVGAASADTFIVPSPKGTTSDEPTLAASHKSGTCVYGDKAVQLGDTVIMAESNIVLVCASAPQGAVFYPLSSAGAAQVVKAPPKAHG